MVTDDDLLDGCDLDFTDPANVTLDGDQVTALVLFADVDWTNPDQVAARRHEWERLADA